MASETYGVYFDGEWRYVAQERQEALHKSTAKNVLYGGAAGGGKSHGARWHGIMACLRHPNFPVLLLRRTFPELDNTHIIKLAMELPAGIGKWRASLRRVTFPNGALMQLGHCEREQDVKAYLSTEWGMIIVDEASTFTPWQLRMLSSRLRTTDPNVRPQFVYATNPGGPAHMYLRERFLDRYVDVEDDPTYNSADYEFIPAFVHDNRWLNPDYVLRLESLPPAEREAYLYGNWEAFAGQYFPEFTRLEHMVEVEKQFVIPEFWERFGGMDWGYSPSPGIIYWNGIDIHERVWTYKELVFKQSAPKEVARMIHERTMDDMEDRMTIYADPSMWTTQPDRGVSIADEINETLADLGSGVVLLPANRDRINGWVRMHQYLDPRRPQPGGGQGSYWRIFQFNEQTGAGCPYLLKTLPGQIHKDDGSGDLDKNSTDHGCDAMRYALMSRPPLTEVPLELRPVPTYADRLQAKTRKVMAQFRHREEQDVYLNPDRVLLPYLDESEDELPQEIWA